MPLVRVVGGRSREEQIGVYQLAPDADGNLRSILTGGPPVLVTGEELRKLAGVAQVEVLDSGASPDEAPVVFDATSAAPPVPGWSPDPPTESETTTQTLSEAGEEEHPS